MKEIKTLYKQLTENKHPLCIENMTGEQIFYQMEEFLNTKLKTIECSLKKSEKKLIKELFFDKKSKLLIDTNNISHEKKGVETTPIMQHDDNLTADETLKLLNESCLNEIEIESEIKSSDENEFN